VPLAGLLAVLVFLAGYIPYFGGIVTTGIILLVTLGALGVGPAVILLVAIAVRNVLLGYWLRPAIYGRTVNIHPALVLVVLPAGFEIAGIVGLFAAVPVTAVLLALGGAVVSILEPIPHPELPGLVPAWLDRVAQWSWRILVAIGLIALVVGVLGTMPLVVLPVLVATILAATLVPLVHWLVGRGRTRSRASAISVGGGFLVVMGLLVISMVALVDQAPQIASATQSGADSASNSLGGQLGLGAEAVRQGGLEALRTIAAFAADVATFAAIIVLSSLLCFYFLRDGDKLWSRVLAHVRPGVVGDVNGAGTRAVDVLGGYMIGTAAIAFVGTFSQYVIMVVLGLPLALPVFVFSFFMNFIPYIGSFISTGIAFLITIAVGSTADIVIMGLWTALFNVVAGNIVGPIVYSKTVHIHPAIVLLAIPAGSAIAGILGMFLVVPALGVVAVTWRTVLSAMGARAAPDVPARAHAVPPDTPAPVLRTEAEPAPG